MGLTGALYTGLSGLNANQTQIDTIGNNIANVNTTAFKGSRTLFQTQFYDTLTAGTAPNQTTGGVNPLQVGHGVDIGTTQKSFTTGAIQTTGINSDLALEGDGFFMLRTPDSNSKFTRDGSFTLDASNRLVTSDGYYVQGYGVDSGFNIDTTKVQDLIVPVGAVTVAHPTANVSLEGDLSADGTLATLSSESRSQQMVDGAAAPATATTLLTDLRSAATPGQPLFIDGDVITVAGVSKGDRELPPQSFVVGTTGTSYGDYAQWLQDRFGIQTAQGVPGAPGVTIDNGALVVRSDAGTQNSIAVTGNDVTSTNGSTPLPFQFTQEANANGSSVFSGFTVYDSLGTPVQVQTTFVLDQLTNQGPVWRFYVESPDASGTTRALGTGTVAFDTQGNVRQVVGNQISLDRSGTGAASPLSFTMDFSRINGLSSKTSGGILNEQDGYPPGKLNGWNVQKDGTIKGTFSNGLSRTLGQVAVATVPNQDGMVAEGENLYAAGPNSGPVSVTVPGNFGAGEVRSGALEMSNVDLGSEFIGLVAASTGFQASSRVISVSSDLLNQLLLVIR